MLNDPGVTGCSLWFATSKELLQNEHRLSIATDPQACSFGPGQWQVPIHLNKEIEQAFDPLFQFLRMVAPLAWVPIALVLFQHNQPAAIVVIVITSIWPILINTADDLATDAQLARPLIHSAL
jgi:hypothetical protein